MRRVRSCVAARPPLQISLFGVYGILGELERSLYLLVAPTLKIFTRFMLRTELPQFLKGFLVQVPGRGAGGMGQKRSCLPISKDRAPAVRGRVGYMYPQANQTVNVYYKFLQRRAALMSRSSTLATDDAATGLSVELFLCSELQRNQELHSALALTAEPSEVGRCDQSRALAQDEAAHVRRPRWYSGPSGRRRTAGEQRDQLLWPVPSATTSPPGPERPLERPGC